MNGFLWLLLGALCLYVWTGTFPSLIYELYATNVVIPITHLADVLAVYFLFYGYVRSRCIPKRSLGQLAEGLIDLVVLHGAVVVQLLGHECRFGHITFTVTITLIHVYWHFLGSTYLSLKDVFYRLTIQVASLILLNDIPENDSVYIIWVMVWLNIFVLTYRLWKYLSSDYIDTKGPLLSSPC